MGGLADIASAGGEGGWGGGGDKNPKPGQAPNSRTNSWNFGSISMTGLFIIHQKFIYNVMFCVIVHFMKRRLFI